MGSVNVGATMLATPLSIVLTASGPAVAAHQTCVAFSGGWTDFTPCTRTDASGHLTVPPRHVHSLKFDKYGLATVWTSGFYYVTRDGRMARVLPFDNGADYFVGGLARTEVRGKVGFIDRKLRVVIPPRYDFAFPFNGGTAVVCNGCKETSDGGEHKSMVGGQWSIIDRHGREIPALHDRSADERPK